MEEGAVEGHHGGRDWARRVERVADSLARRRRVGEKRRDGDERDTCSERVHAFQGFRENGEYDGGDVSLNIWRGRDFKRTRVTALGRRLNNAKSTYSRTTVPSRVSVSFFSFLFRLSMSFNLLSSRSFSLSLLRFFFSRSHPPLSLVRQFSPPGLFQSTSPFSSFSRYLYPFLFSNLSYYRVILFILRLVGTISWRTLN